MPRQSLFLHIQKTAGTSVVKSVSENYGHDLISHLDYWTLSSDDIQRVGFISGHFGYDYARQFMKDRYSFTFLRNPVERVLSFYHYACKEADNYDYEVFKVARNHSIEDFLSKCSNHSNIKPYVWNHQVWQLACGWGNRIKKSINSCDPEAMLEEAKRHISAFNHVGFVETIEQDMELIFENLGIERRGGIKRENSTGRSNSLNVLSSKARNCLHELTKYDQMFYDYAWSLRGDGKKR